VTLPPQNVEAERAVLGAALAGSRLVEDAAGILQPRDFYRPAHETIWRTIIGMTGPVDALTVSAALGAELVKVGGAPYLLDLASVESSPNPAAMLSYAQQVRDSAVRRRLVEAGIKVQQLGETATDVTQAAEDAAQAVADAGQHAATTEAGMSAEDALEEAIGWLETPPVGADTPWSDVNERTNGLLAGQMVTVAGRPGHGKSLVLKDVAVFTAMQGKPVHIASLEMSRNEYIARILAGLGRIDLGRMLRRQLSEGDWGKVADASERLRGLPLYLDDRADQSMAQIRAAARQTQRRYGRPLGLVGVDYAQLVRPALRLKVREQEVAQISRDTKLMAKEFHCPVMLLAQLNRGNTQRTDHTPQVSDLRESGSLEQDSDQVWLLHRPDQYGGEASMDRMGEVDLIVGKNRNGPAPTTVALAFLGHNGLIASLA
jgi:replicative DNA helicase